MIINLLVLQQIEKQMRFCGWLARFTAFLLICKQWHSGTPLKPCYITVFYWIIVCALLFFCHKTALCNCSMNPLLLYRLRVYSDLFSPMSVSWSSAGSLSLQPCLALILLLSSHEIEGLISVGVHFYLFFYVFCRFHPLQKRVPPKVRAVLLFIPRWAGFPTSSKWFKD